MNALTLPRTRLITPLLPLVFIFVLGSGLLANSDGLVNEQLLTGYNDTCFISYGCN